MIDTTKLECGCCGVTFNFETEGGVLTRHMQAEKIECRACAYETRAFDARLQAAQILLNGINLHVTDSEGPYDNRVQDVGNPIPGILEIA
jgi:hypothetical protein